MSGVAGGASGAGAQPADCIRAIQHYILKMLKPKDPLKAISGTKALLLDRETKTIVSMVMGMHEILAKEVYLVETLDAKHDASVAHVKAVCLLRPTAENIRALVAHLSDPKFLEYHIFFTNFVPQDMLRKLADADHMSVVKQVQEFYADYYAVNPDMFTLNLSGSTSLSRPKSSYGTHEDTALKRTIQGTLALLLSLKLKPYVRFQAASDVSAAIARDITGTMSGERELFTFPRAGSALLLVLDRREDPVTPLLSQWTYQAMIHELLPGGLKNNTVDLSSIPGIPEDLRQLVLASSQDKFFSTSMHSNFGDLGVAVKAMLDKYSSQKGSHAALKTIEDMQRFVESYPELKAQGSVVSKHVTLLSEITAAVEKKHIFELSEVEQNVACSADSATDHFSAVVEVLRTPGIDPLDALRLLMIFALRYEKSKPEKVAELRRFVREIAGDKVDLVDTLLAYGGASVRSGDLFGTSSGGMLSRLTRAVQLGVRGVENVFTQHQPLLVSLLDQLAKGRLAKAAFPYVGAEPSTKPSTVIVLIVGGVTFEEAAKIAAINAGQLSIGGAGAPSMSTGAPSAAGGSSAPPFRVILGGTQILNSRQFLAELIADGTAVVDMAQSDSAGGVGAR